MAAIGLLAVVLTACGYPDPAPDNGPVATTQETTPTPVNGGDDFNEGSNRTPVKFPDGLQYIDLKTGTGPVVPEGATVSVQYTGWLASNGTKFDSSRDRNNEALCVILSQGTQQPQGDCTPVIVGWDEGVPGMKVGGRRKLIIPPALGYGDQAQGPIPAGSKLVFTVELLSIVAQPTPTPSRAAKPTPTP